MCHFLTLAGPLLPQMVQSSPDGLLYYSSDLELYSWRVSGQQQPVEDVQQLHSQQLGHKEQYSIKQL